MSTALGAVELAAAAGPAALSMAVVVTGTRIRSGLRRRDLNRSLHELRRPLQALALGGSPEHLERAMDALGDLDRRVNGESESFAPRPLPGRELVERAAERWRDMARQAGGDVRVVWAAGDVRVAADPSRFGAALDNLLANAVEHGRGPVDVSAALCPAGLRIVVSNRRRGGTLKTRRGDPRRGHGLGMVRRIARAHRGELHREFRDERHLAILEIPVIAQIAPGLRTAEA